MKFRRYRSCCALLLGVSVCSLAACGPPASHANENGSGTLQLGRSGELNGTHYFLEATFDLAGPESLTLDSAHTTTTLNRDLAPGAYAITIEPGFRVLQDVAVAEVPVASALLSDAVQAFQITSRVAKRVTYRFALEAGTVSFDAD